MKIVQINATCGVGSTGKICVGISEQLSAENIENYILYSSISDGYELGTGCADRRYIRLQALRSRAIGNYGFNSEKATERIIEELEKIKPDIVHLHNIHGHDCNLEMLFGYFRQKNIKLLWTFHDCWAFTGYCSYFTESKCDKWQTQCDGCVQRRNFSWFFDRSRTLFEKKKRLFTGLDMTVVSPSEWLASLIKQSFFKEYPVKVINNGINLKVFKPCKSDFRKKYGLEDSKIVLGVSFDWSERKGLDVFTELSERLPSDYRIVIVGVQGNAVKQLPDDIITVGCTRNQAELAEIYSCADVFVNPTREDNFPTVNMEALACGTPVLTFRTGGSPEIPDSTCGVAVECGDTDSLEKEIIRICSESPYSTGACVMRAKSFDENIKLREYVELYRNIYESI